MTNAIKQRAKKYADNFVVGDAYIIVDILHKCAEESYMAGSTDQEAIDEIIWEKDMHYVKFKNKLIYKACEWLKDELGKLAVDKIENDFLQNDFKVILKEDVAKWIDDFRKAMEDKNNESK